MDEKKLFVKKVFEFCPFSSLSFFWEKKFLFCFVKKKCWWQKSFFCENLYSWQKCLVITIITVTTFTTVTSFTTVTTVTYVTTVTMATNVCFSYHVILFKGSSLKKWLYLHQNKGQQCWQHIRTTPLPSYRAPTLLEIPSLTSVAMVPSRRIGIALFKGRGGVLIFWHFLVD